MLENDENSSFSFGELAHLFGACVAWHGQPPLGSDDCLGLGDN